MTDAPALAPPAALRPAAQRLRAFCSPDGPEVFHAIVRPEDIGSTDPFDVETIADMILQDFDEFTGDVPAFDDQTLIVIKVR